MPKILVVDDEEKIRDILVKFMEKAGFEVMQAPGGREAIETLRQDNNSIDLMVVDMKMPKVTGADVLREKSRLGKSFPAILLTGSVDAEKYLMGLKEVGLTEEDICYKPVDLFVLLEMIKKRLGIAP